MGSEYINIKLMYSDPFITLTPLLLLKQRLTIARLQAPCFALP